jgi:SAM-dependent methyltransferase
LDIGCRNAGLLFFARNDGWQVRGLELSAATAKSIRADTGIDVAVGDFLSYEGNDAGTYDVVVLRHVLEHLPDSILAMEQIGRLLKPNGQALLEFPNTASAAYLVKRFLKNRGLRNKKYSKEWRPGHCNEFCRKAFIFLLEKTGFELVDWHTYSNKPVTNFFYRLVPIGSKARALVRKVS